MEAHTKERDDESRELCGTTQSRSTTLGGLPRLFCSLDRTGKPAQLGCGSVNRRCACPL